ncbi:MAG: hypothetical protein R6V83_07170 [Candidatus Thorarchaeota archaeon]
MTKGEGSLLGLVRNLSLVGLGRWATPERGKGSAPKAVRKTRSSKQKSSLSKKGSSSDPGESAAVRCVQLDLSGFGDETGQSDNNPAVAKAVEDLAAPGCDVSGQGRRQKPRPKEGPCPDDGGQCPCLAGGSALVWRRRWARKGWNTGVS